MFLGGLVFLIGRPHQAISLRFPDSMVAALLLAIAILVRPNFAPMAGVLLGGAGIAALWQRQYRRLSGMCIGFVPVFLAALHNWYYGGAFVLFSSNADLSIVYVMPASSYVLALFELLTFQFGGEHLARAAKQILWYLGGPREWLVMVPVHAAAIAIQIRVLAGKRFDAWLRLIAAAVLVGHVFAVMFLIVPRYYLPIWLLTLLISAVWLQREGWPWLAGRVPQLNSLLACRWGKAFGKMLARFENIVEEPKKLYGSLGP
jgi:hypothetical protein